MSNVRNVVLGVAVLFLSSCGGGSSDTEDLPRSGFLIDSAVQGVDYSTATQSSTTDADGRFTYLPGEQITFSIGAIAFPTVEASDRITPVDLAEGSNDPQATTTNIARLLQSLDRDGNPDNGITIPTEVVSSSALVDFDVPVETS